MRALLVSVTEGQAHFITFYDEISNREGKLQKYVDLVCKSAYDRSSVVGSQTRAQKQSTDETHHWR